MNLLLRIPYGMAAALAQGLSYIMPDGDSKLQRGLVARRGILNRYRAWGAASRDASRPLVWFHAPSVGEGLQALPVIRLLRSRRPDAQIAYTHYSPSAEQFAGSAGADFTDYLPFDGFGFAAGAIAALKPKAIVFSKLDVWPALTETAAQQNVRTGVISATLPQSSGRRSTVARFALGDAYRALDRVGAVSADDAARLREQGVRADRLSITGDTRYDQVWTRATAIPPRLVQALRSPTRAPTLVAGSTWPSDEKHLLAAWIETRKRVPTARLIIAPHELDPSHLSAIVTWARDHQLSVSRVDESSASTADVVLVDKYGILGDIYSVGDAAYVGGGFHSAGLHSVLEPAAFGLPVLFGPRHARSRDAVALIASGGGFSVGNEGELIRRLEVMLSGPREREAAGAAAKSMVQSGLGAAERSFQLVTELLGP